MEAERTDLTSAAVISGLAALAHGTRLALFRQLVRKGQGGESAGELAQRLQIPPQTLSFHLKEMTHAGLLRSQRQGRHVYYTVDFGHARRLVAYLSDSCCADDEATPPKGGQRHDCGQRQSARQGPPPGRSTPGAQRRGW